MTMKTRVSNYCRGMPRSPEPPQLTTRGVIDVVGAAVTRQEDMTFRTDGRTGRDTANGLVIRKVSS